MIPKSLDNIAEEDLLNLITNEVRESRTIEYKRELPGGSDADKKEFLADASSFANTSGGDLILGVSESNGLPQKIVGVYSGDLDLEMRRLDDILASGLDPRIRYTSRLVDCRDNNKVLVIRVERSWSGPHRVIFKGHDKFYGRNATGKYPLDVSELRTAFTLSNTVVERIRAFRTDRIIAISNNDTPVPFADEAKIVLHCIPIESLAILPQFDVRRVGQNDVRLSPMGVSGWNSRFNLEGWVGYDGYRETPSESYIQFYRNGVTEAVRVVAHEYQGRRLIPSVAYERWIRDSLTQYLQALKMIGVSAPIVIALAITKARGLSMGVNLSHSGGHAIQENTMILPEAILHEFSESVDNILRPMFDVIWNACGFPASSNYNAEGNWVPRG